MACFKLCSCTWCGVWHIVKWMPERLDNCVSAWCKTITGKYLKASWVNPLKLPILYGIQTRLRPEPQHFHPWWWFRGHSSACHSLQGSTEYLTKLVYWSKQEYTIDFLVVWRYWSTELSSLFNLFVYWLEISCVIWLYASFIWPQVFDVKGNKTN